MTLRKSSPRKKQRWSLLVLLVSVLLLVGQISGAIAGASSDSGFEGNDGNLAVTTTGNVDWNSFDTIPWQGTAPTRTALGTHEGWNVTGLEDHQVSTADSAFAGGTKQDDTCPTVNTAKAPNKDDLKRVYFAHKTLEVAGVDHVFLGLAWVRIPQNTTSASAHVGFEFNKGETACGTGSDSLVERTVGDRLFVYDFAGGTDNPSIKLLKWVTDSSFTCEASGKPATSAGCWTLEVQDLTQTGAAEARVNTGTTLDAFIDGDENLGTQEFGEAIIDLTAAGIFTPGTCESFGQAFAVSRSSGNSAQAQMKDLVGPGTVDIKNCGSVVINKVTSPDPDPLDTSFGFTTTGGLEDEEGDADKFALKNGESMDYGDEVLNGSYSVSEDDPSPNYALTDIDCSASVTTGGSTISITGSGGAGDDDDFQAGDDTVSFTLAGEDSIDCTFTNALQNGAIQVTKTAKNANCALEVEDEDRPAGCDIENNAPLAGAAFEIWQESNNAAGLQTEADDGDPGDPDDDVPADTKVKNAKNTTLNADEDLASACFDGLLFGPYYVLETSAPSGYAKDATNPRTSTVDNAATCTEEVFGGETVAFENTPLSQIQVIFTSLAGDGVTIASISCEDGSSAAVTPVSENGEDDPALDDTNETITNLAPDTYTCTVVVDP